MPEPEPAAGLSRSPRAAARTVQYPVVAVAAGAIMPFVSTQVSTNFSKMDSLLSLAASGGS